MGGRTTMTCDTLPQLFVLNKKSTYSKKEFSSLVPSFDPEGVVCVGVDVGGLNLEDVRRHSPLRLDAHVFVDNWRWETLALSLRPADAATVSKQQGCQSLWNHFDNKKRMVSGRKK